MTSSIRLKMRKPTTPMAIVEKEPTLLFDYAMSATSTGRTIISSFVIEALLGQRAFPSMDSWPLQVPYASQEPQGASLLLFLRYKMHAYEAKEKTIRMWLSIFPSNHGSGERN